jgi:hypothetical protein
MITGAIMALQSGWEGSAHTDNKKEREGKQQQQNDMPKSIVKEKIIIIIIINGSYIALFKDLKSL